MRDNIYNCTVKSRILLRRKIKLILENCLNPIAWNELEPFFDFRSLIFFFKYRRKHYWNTNMIKETRQIFKQGWSFFFFPRSLNFFSRAKFVIYQWIIVRVQLKKNRKTVVTKGRRVVKINERGEKIERSNRAFFIVRPIHAVASFEKT